jgi:holo-[acyl-carrier protein] synthase
MVLGIGMDLVEIERIAHVLASHGERFERRVFTPGELRDCAARSDRVRALAARFAAKEACLKALGTGMAEGLALRHVEVVRAPSGRPDLRLHDAAEARARSLGVRRMHVSLTHQDTVAGAVVVLER